jgi:hypothetical protein
VEEDATMNGIRATGVAVVTGTVLIVTGCS